MSEKIPSPEEFFGHQMGADRKLARWDRVVEYFNVLGKSPCVKVTELGKSTEGNPFILSRHHEPGEHEEARQDQGGELEDRPPAGGSPRRR